MEFLRALLQRHMKVAWRRRWLGVGIAWLVCVLGWAAVLALPNQYVASARLYVDVDAVLTPLLSGLAVNTSPEAKIEMLQRTLLSRPNVEKLIDKTDLDLTVNGPTERDRLVQALQKAVSIHRESRNLFTISYRNTKPALAQKVVQTLLSIFIEAATGGNRRDVENARRFLEHQIASYGQQLRSAEQRRTQFRNKYAALFSPGADFGPAALEALHTQIAELAQRIQDQTFEQSVLKKELEGTSPMLVAESTPGEASQLAQAEERLRLLRLQYTDSYPGVIALKKQIEALKRAPPPGTTSAATSSAPGGAHGGHDRSVPNPVYDQIKVKLVEVQGQIGALQRKLQALKRYEANFETLQRAQPNIVAQYQDLERNYSVLQHNYDELLGRLQSANLAEAADTQADKVQIRVVDPPNLPHIPVAPNRFLLITGVLIVGLGTGTAVPVLLSQLDRSFWVVDDLRSLGLPVLGGISLLAAQGTRRQVMAALRIGVVVVMLLAAYGGLLAHLLHIRSSV